jgi:integrase/recombinase XerD
MAQSIHDYEARLATVLRKLERSTISKEDKKVIERFKDECFSNGLSKGRVIKYMYYLILLSEWLGNDFGKAQKEDIKALAAKIESSSYAEYTKKELKICLRKLYKWLKNSEDYPEEVRWIKTYSRKLNRIKMPEEILTEEDVQRLIIASASPRDRAFIAILYESGCRIGEMLFIRIKHLHFDQYGVQMYVDGKTGPRKVRILTSVPYLTEWLNKHPSREPDSYIWASRHGSVLGYGRVRNLLRQAGRRAGIRKRLNPHIFRHSRATFLAHHLTESQMKEFFGWVQASDMAGIYVHMSGRDVDSHLLAKVYGVRPNGNGENETVLKPRTCPRCNQSNAPTNRFCSVCGMVLDKETMVSIVQNDMERRKADSTLDELLKDEEFREVFVRKITDIAEKKKSHSGLSKNALP